MVICHRVHMRIYLSFFQYSLCRVVLMVWQRIRDMLASSLDFQYSLCRVVLMVSLPASLAIVHHPLSVLALSSRFDGQIRTDSLCRDGWPFQYSLCRVVLMVHSCRCDNRRGRALSVLALSSRFDGQKGMRDDAMRTITFSTRSVESF